MTLASAPGKIILCGEHAVVYGRPAIALPLPDLRAQVVVRDGEAGSGITIDAPDLERRWTLASAPAHPLSELVVGILDHLRADAVSAHTSPTTAPIDPSTLDLLITITSSIPIAGGMGSGAAVATALVRALATHLGRDLTAEAVSELVYSSEQRFHGTPSGIDNTVIAFERPIWFVRPTTNDQRPTTNDDRKTRREGDQETANTQHATRNTQHATRNTQYAIRNTAESTIEPVEIASPLTLLIGDSGVRSPTHMPVGEVRAGWQADPARYEALFDAIAALVAGARSALAQGDIPALGALLDENHNLLRQIGVSSDDLDRLVAAARAAGALGAKLSGAGWGGVIVALVTPASRERVAEALASAGAARVLATRIGNQANV